MNDFEFDNDDDFMFDMGTAAVAGDPMSDRREEIAQSKFEQAVNLKRSGYANMRDVVRTPYTLSMDKPGDDEDMRDILRQGVLVVPHADIINALDLARTIRAEIKGLKKGDLANTEDMMTRYARYLYTLVNNVEDVRGLPSNDPYWKKLDAFHKAVDPFVYKGEGRDNLLAAINGLPENVKVIYIRDEATDNEFATRELGSSRVSKPSTPKSFMKKREDLEVITPVRDLDIESIVADIVRDVSAKLQRTYAKSATDKQSILATRMPDGTSGVYEKLLSVTAKHPNAADIAERVQASAIKVPVNEPVNVAVREKPKPRAKAAAKRAREDAVVPQ